MSKDHALLQYRKLVDYFDKLEIVGIHIKHLIENAKTDEDLSYLSDRIQEFHLMLTEDIILRKVSNEIIDIYDELEIDINSVNSNEDINSRIKSKIK